MRTPTDAISDPALEKIVSKRKLFEVCVLTVTFSWLAAILVLELKNRSLLAGDARFLIERYQNFHIWHAYFRKAITSTAIAIWIIWLGIKCGETILEKAIPSAKLTVLEKRVLAAGLGLVAISMLTLLLGAIRLWYVSIFWIVLIVGTIVYFPGKLSPVKLHKSVPSVTSLKEWWAKCAFCIFLLAALVILVGDLSPETFYDSLHYHLGMPNLYLLNHRIYNEPDFAYASFIMVVQMFWGFALTVGNEITVKVLHGAMILLLFFAFIALERRYLARNAGLLGALIFVSMPLVGVSAASAGIDVASSALQFLAVFTLIHALSDDYEETATREWMRLAGLFTGIAATCRYTCLPAIPIACILIGWKRRQQRREWSAVARQLRVFLIYAALVMFPFYLKNAVFHYNPVYPVGGLSWGKPKVEARNWNNIMNATLPPHFSGASSFLEIGFRFFHDPWSFALNGKDAHQDFVGPLLLGLLPLLLIRSGGGASGVLAGYSLLFWLTWLITNTVHLRFGMPMLAILSILLAHAVLSISSVSVLRNAVLMLCLLGAGWNLYYSVLVMGYKEGWLVVGGMVSENDYLATAHFSYPRPDYEGLIWMNNNLPAGSKVMMAGDARSFYSRIPVIPASIFDTQPLVLVAREAGSGADMARRLHEKGVTHLFLNFAEAVRTESYEVFAWDKHSWTVFDDFWQHNVRLVWSSVSGGLYPKALFVYQIANQENEHSSSFVPPNLFERWKPKE